MIRVFPCRFCGGPHTVADIRANDPRGGHAVGCPYRTIPESQLDVVLAVEHLSGDGWPVTVREVATEIGRTVSSTHRELTRATAAGLLETNPRWQSGRGGWRPTE